jgi:hypothetical protein
VAVIRGILAVLIGVFVAAAIGAAYDYLKLSFIPNPAEWTFIWPYVFAGAGAIAAVIAVVLYVRWSRVPQPGASGPRREPLTKQRAKAAPPAKDKVTLSTSSDVPGMPTFEVDRSKQAKPGQKTGDK